MTTQSAKRIRTKIMSDRSGMSIRYWQNEAPKIPGTVTVQLGKRHIILALESEFERYWAEKQREVKPCAAGISGVAATSGGVGSHTKADTLNDPSIQKLKALLATGSADGSRN
jgi:hypothetical protein